MQGLRKYQDHSESVYFESHPFGWLICLASQILGVITQHPQKRNFSLRWCIKINKWNISYNRPIVILIYSLLYFFFKKL